LLDTDCEIKVYDRDFNWIAATRAAESVQFTRELYGAGTFQITVSARTRGAADMLTGGNIVVINGDPHRSGIIRDFTVERKRAGCLYSIRGETGAGLARQRLSVPPTQAQDPSALGYDRINAPAETVIKHYINANLASPYDAARAIPGLIVAPDMGRGAAFPAQLRFGKLDEDLADICRYAGMGYEICADCAAGKWVMDVIPGADRTVSQTANGPVIFAAEEQNVSEYRYVENRANYKNAAYCGGAGENESRLIQVVGGGAGLDRYEVFIDCGNANVTDLLALGQIKLADYQAAKTLDLTALPRVFVFGRDYFLGDLVTVYVNDIGLALDSRIEAVTEVWERGAGYSAQARFGGKIPNLFTVLADKSAVR